MGSKRQKMDIPTSSKGECPVCFQIPRAKVFQCANGHSICEDCSEKVTVCPTCRSSGVRIRNLYAESLLDDMELKCSWSGQGCDKTMWRGELTAHEDQCNQNPAVIIKFCSMYHPVHRHNCQYKFTSQWLSERENCTDFLNHVKTCLAYRSFVYIEYGHRHNSTLGFHGTLSERPILVKPAHHYYNPDFFRLASPNHRGKDDLFFRILLVKVDKLGNKTVSFPFVQLTPQRTPIYVNFSIDGSRTSKMTSHWGRNSLPSQNWTQKTIGFKEFLQLVDETSQRCPETGIPLPLFLPVSFLSEYYADENKELVVSFSLESDA